jgi:hypothetical protein
MMCHRLSQNAATFAASSELGAFTYYSSEITSFKSSDETSSLSEAIINFVLFTFFWLSVPLIVILVGFALPSEAMLSSSLPFWAAELLFWIKFTTWLTLLLFAELALYLKPSSSAIAVPLLYS